MVLHSLVLAANQNSNVLYWKHNVITQILKSVSDSFFEETSLIFT